MDNDVESAVVDDTTAQVQLKIEQLAALVGPVLTELFSKAVTNDDMWLKKKSVQHLALWIQSVQDTSDLMRQTIDAMQNVITSQEQELEKLRPVKGKIWTPLG